MLRPFVDFKVSLTFGKDFFALLGILDVFIVKIYSNLSTVNIF